MAQVLFPHGWKVNVMVEAWAAPATVRRPAVAKEINERFICCSWKDDAPWRLGTTQAGGVPMQKKLEETDV
jgi:hypothetical protein